VSITKKRPIALTQAISNDAGLFIHEQKGEKAILRQEVQHLPKAVIERKSHSSPSSQQKGQIH
jgi:hypothetical protein